MSFFFFFLLFLLIFNPTEDGAKTTARRQTQVFPDASFLGALLAGNFLPLPNDRLVPPT
jgi:hypothetical protein